jgi:hypothetical protein
MGLVNSALKKNLFDIVSSGYNDNAKQYTFLAQFYDDNIYHINESDKAERYYHDTFKTFQLKDRLKIITLGDTHVHIKENHLFKEYDCMIEYLGTFEHPNIVTFLIDDLNINEWYLFSEIFTIPDHRWSHSMYKSVEYVYALSDFIGVRPDNIKAVDTRYWNQKKVEFNTYSEYIKIYTVMHAVNRILCDSPEQLNWKCTDEIARKYDKYYECKNLLEMYQKIIREEDTLCNQVLTIFIQDALKFYHSALFKIVNKNKMIDVFNNTCGILRRNKMLHKIKEQFELHISKAKSYRTVSTAIYGAKINVSYIHSNHIMDMKTLLELSRVYDKSIATGKIQNIIMTYGSQHFNVMDMFDFDIGAKSFEEYQRLNPLYPTPFKYTMHFFRNRFENILEDCKPQNLSREEFIKIYFNAVKLACESYSQNPGHLRGYQYHNQISNYICNTVSNIKEDIIKNTETFQRHQLHSALVTSRIYNALCLALYDDKLIEENDKLYISNNSGNKIPIEEKKPNEYKSPIPDDNLEEVKSLLSEINVILLNNTDPELKGVNVDEYDEKIKKFTGKERLIDKNMGLPNSDRLLLNYDCLRMMYKESMNNAVSQNYDKTTFNELKKIAFENRKMLILNLLRILATGKNNGYKEYGNYINKIEIELNINNEDLGLWIFDEENDTIEEKFDADIILQKLVLLRKKHMNSSFYRADAENMLKKYIDRLEEQYDPLYSLSLEEKYTLEYLNIKSKDKDEILREFSDNEIKFGGGSVAYQRIMKRMNDPKYSNLDFASVNIAPSHYPTDMIGKLNTVYNNADHINNEAQKNLFIDLMQQWIEYYKRYVMEFPRKIETGRNLGELPNIINTTTRYTPGITTGGALDLNIWLIVAVIIIGLLLVIIHFTFIMKKENCNRREKINSALNHMIY